MELNGWTSPQMLRRYGASARRYGASARRYGASARRYGASARSCVGADPRTGTGATAAYLVRNCQVAWPGPSLSLAAPRPAGFPAPMPLMPWCACPPAAPGGFGAPPIILSMGMPPVRANR
jgi:hypothetical protein